MTNDPKDATLGAFNEALNSHGYAFQYAVLQDLKKLNQVGGSPWVFEASEFPVEVGGHETRVDFILKRMDSPHLLIAECKRANPAYSTWCFARVPWVARGKEVDQLVLEALGDAGGGQVVSSVALGGRAVNAVHVALEVKTDKKGDKAGHGKGVIDDAATQVCRGFNGLVDHLRSNLQMLPTSGRVPLLPVIFTTAELWVTEAYLPETDFATGNIDLRKWGFEKKPLVSYQYHMSRSTKHGGLDTNRYPTLADALQSTFIRTIPIVSVAHGMVPFVDWTRDGLPR